MRIRFWAGRALPMYGQTVDTLHLDIDGAHYAVRADADGRPVLEPVWTSVEDYLAGASDGTLSEVASDAGIPAGYREAATRELERRRAIEDGIHADASRPAWLYPDGGAQ